MMTKHTNEFFVEKTAGMKAEFERIIRMTTLKDKKDTLRVMDVNLINCSSYIFVEKIIGGSSDMDSHEMKDKRSKCEYKDFSEYVYRTRDLINSSRTGLQHEIKD